jgi:hypothetical protein
MRPLEPDQGKHNKHLFLRSTRVDGHSLRFSAIILSVTRPPQRRFRHAALGFASQPCDWFAFVEDRRRQGLAASEAGCASLTCETDAASIVISHWKPMSDSPRVKRGLEKTEIVARRAKC